MGRRRGGRGREGERRGKGREGEGTAPLSQIPGSAPEHQQIFVTTQSDINLF